MGYHVRLRRDRIEAVHATSFLRLRLERLRANVILLREEVRDQEEPTLKAAGDAIPG
jgi:hypothetical protein